MQKYSMLVFSRPVEGGEEEYLKWYSGQHIHDLLRIPGFTACRFYKVTNAQMFGTKEDKRYQYLMIWDMETDDIAGLIEEIRQRKKDGRSKVCPFFDPDQYNVFCAPVTEWISGQEIRGFAVEEVNAVSKLWDNSRELAEI